MVSGDTFKRFSRTLGAAPTSAQTSCLGCVINTVLTSAGITDNYLPNTTGVLIPSPGIWLINYVVRLTATSSTISRFLCWISSPSTGYTTLSLGFSEISTSQPVNSTLGATALNGSGVLNVTNTTTYIYVHAIVAITSGIIGVESANSYLQFTKIG